MGDLAATLPLYSARPQLAIDGRIDQRLSAGIVSLSVHESDQGPYRCEVTLGNWGANSEEVGYLYFDRTVFDFGSELTIEVGDGDAAAQIIAGRITGIEGRYTQQRPPEVLILAEDRLQDLRMVRRTRTFEDATVDDVVSRIANDHGLQSEIDLDSPTYRVLAQLNQSDLAFLRDCARAVDAEVWIDGSTLHAQARSRRQTDTLTLTYGQRLHEFSVIADLAHQRTHLAVGGWDVGAKEAFDYEVDSSAVRSELDDGIGGGAILESKFSRRRETIVHCTPASDQEARTLAEAHYRKIARRFVTGRGKAEGDGRLRAGSHVTLERLGQLFDGRYYVTDVHHTFSLTTGYNTYFSVERPGLGAD